MNLDPLFNCSKANFQVCMFSKKVIFFLLLLDTFELKKKTFKDYMETGMNCEIKILDYSRTLIIYASFGFR